VAKPRPVHGLDPERRLRPNARKVLAVRIDEVYSYDGLMADPANVTELHDMRIACKRLRYLLEIFAVAFPADLEPFIDEVKGLQDLLGDIHDCDVQIPMLEDHLDWLARREGAVARRLVTTAPPVPRRRSARGREDDFRAFERELATARRGDERPGVHALIGRRRRERDALHARFVGEWRRLKGERFRPRLNEALGIGRHG
jgi:CHAD domain